MLYCPFQRIKKFAVWSVAVLWAVGMTMAQTRAESPEEVKERLLRALFTDRSAKVRAQAALSLADFTNDESVLDALIQTMSDKSPVVRGTVARVLGLSRAKRAFGVLCQASFDKDKFVAKWASEGLLEVLKGGHNLKVSVDVQVGNIRNATSVEREDIRRMMMDGLLSVLTKESNIDIETRLIDFEGNGGFSGARDDIMLSVVAQLEDARKEDGVGVATVKVRVTSVHGCKVWEGTGEGRAVAKKAEEDEFRDEYSMPTPEIDPRIEASETGARQAILAFIRTIREQTTETLTKGGQDGR